MKGHKFIAMDLETTGKYPLSSEICEIAMIKFDDTGVLNDFESLICPQKNMGKEAQAVHGLSLESLKNAPSIRNVLPEVLEFIGEASLLGHNLSFDLGFLAVELDKYFNEPWWLESFRVPNFCTGLMSLQKHPELITHRLKYLTQYFKVKTSPNHRALQDAQACMEVFLKLTEGMASLKDLVAMQKDELLFKSFSIRALVEENPKFQHMVNACNVEEDFELMYSKGSKKNQWRKLMAKGLVMKTQGLGFVVGVDDNDIQTKRFMLKKILDSRPVCSPVTST